MFAVLPDVDAALIGFLVAHPALAPLHNGRVGHALAPGTATAIRVASIGGTQPWPWEGTSEYQIECWGGTVQQANTLARTVVAAAYDLRGPVPGGWVSSTEVTLRPLDSPDTTGRPRLIVQVSITAHPEEPTP